MDLKIYQGDQTKDADQVRAIFWEYLHWANAKINENYNISFEVQTLLDEDMLGLDKFMPPKGRLLLCDGGEELAGIACLRDDGEGIGEIKRMYVRPAYRRLGIGGALISRALAEARAIGYRSIRLDSAKFMHDAHSLYRSFGFEEIGPYAASEIPQEFQVNWVFMEKTLV